MSGWTWQPTDAGVAAELIEMAREREIDRPVGQPWRTYDDVGRTSARATRPAPPPRLVARRAEDVIAEPAPASIVEGLVWAGCVTVLAAESGAGKSFVGLDIAAHLSAGATWHGRIVDAPGSTVYVAYEADAIGLRLRGLRDVRQLDCEHIYVVRGTDPLSPSLARDGTETRSVGELDLVAALERLRDDLAPTRPPIRLVAIDTARASMAGSEDASDSVSAYLRAVRRILAVAPEAGALLVHHAGWQDGEDRRRRERGSSAWRANVDATLYLAAGTYDAHAGTCDLRLESVKVRDGERPAPLRLVRRRVVLPGLQDRHGRPITTCIIESDTRTAEDREHAEQAAADAAAREVDLRVLRVIAEYPDATSQTRIRQYCGLGTTVVAASIGRLTRDGWLRQPERQRQPYELTDAARELLRS